MANYNILEQSIRQLQQKVKYLEQMTGTGVEIQHLGPIPTISVRRQRDRQGFWALVTDYQADGDRYLYAVEQAYKAGEGYDTWDYVTNGLAGYAYNATPSGSTPVPVGTPVWIQPIGGEYWFSGGISSSGSSSSTSETFWARVGVVDQTIDGRWRYEFVEAYKGLAGYGNGNPISTWPPLDGGRSGSCYNGAEMPVGTYDQIPQGSIVLIQATGGEYWTYYPVNTIDNLFMRIDSYVADGTRWFYTGSLATHSTSGTGWQGWQYYPNQQYQARNLAESASGSYTPISSGTVVELTKTPVGSGYDYLFTAYPGTITNAPTITVSGEGQSWSLATAAGSGVRLLHELDTRWSDPNLQKLTCYLTFGPDGKLLEISSPTWTTIDTAVICSGYGGA